MPYRYGELILKGNNYVKEHYEKNDKPDLRGSAVGFLSRMFPVPIEDGSKRLQERVEFLQKVFPTFKMPVKTSEERSGRRRVMQRARKEIAELIVDRAIAEKKMSPFVLPNRAYSCLIDYSEEATEKNNRLAEAMKKNDPGEMGALWDEKLAEMELPDLDKLNALSDWDLVKDFRKYDQLSLVAQESARLLEEAKAGNLQLGDAAKEKLETLVGQMSHYAFLRQRMELIADPMYEYVDLKDLPLNKQAKHDAMIAGDYDSYMADYCKIVTSLLSSVGGRVGEQVRHGLQQQGFNADQWMIGLGSNGKWVGLSANSNKVDGICMELQLDRPICLRDEQDNIYTFKMDKEGKPVPVDAKKVIFGTMQQEFSSAAALMDGAHRGWLLTGSNEFAQARRLSHQLLEQSRDPALSREDMKKTLGDILTQTAAYEERKRRSSSGSPLEKQRVEAMSALRRMAEKKLYEMRLYEVVDYIGKEKLRREKKPLRDESKIQTNTVSEESTAMHFETKEEKKALMEKINAKYLDGTEDKRESLTKQRAALRNELYGIAEVIDRDSKGKPKFFETKGLMDVRGEKYDPRQQKMARRAMARMYILDIVALERKEQGPDQFGLPGEGTMERQLMEKGEDLVEELAKTLDKNVLIGEVRPCDFQQFMEKGSSEKIKLFFGKVAKKNEPSIPEKKQPQPSKEQGGKVIGGMSGGN